MPDYAYPTQTDVFDEATVATLKDNLNETAIPQGYRNCLGMQLFLGKNKEPGLESAQGTNLKLPGMRPKTKVMGGTRATAFVDFEEGKTAQWFSSYDILDTSIGDGATETWVDWAFITCYVGLPLTDKIKNTGPQKRLDRLMHIQNREIRKLMRTSETALWSTNTDTVEGSQSAFPGMRHKIRLDPTTSVVVQGLNQSTFTPWRNQYSTMGSFATNGLDYMRSMYFSMSGQNAMEPPHLVVTTPTVAGYLVKALEGIHRVVGSLNGQDLSASRLPTFMGIPFVHTEDCPSGYQYWFNFDYMVSLIHEGANWSEFIPGRPNDQLIEDQKRYVLGAAPLMITRRERFGVIGGITA